jgi:hypothetical protein
MVDIFNDKLMFPLRGVVIPCLGLHPDHDKAFSSGWWENPVAID